jgi:hypothetical protein
MMEVVGFEGRIPGDAPVSWAVAILRENGVVINPLTGTNAAQERLDELVDRDSVTLLEEPALVSAQVRYIVSIRKGHRLFETLDLEEGSRQTAEKHSSGLFIHLLFETDSKLNAYIRRTTVRLAALASSAPVIGDEQVAAIKAGLVLDPQDPVLLAFRVAVGDSNAAFLERMARQSLTGDLARRFNLVLSGLRSVRPYEMQYEGGVAKDGGLDLPHTQTVINGFAAAHPRFQSHISEQFEFLRGNEAEPHLQELRAASAHFVFRTNLPDEPLANRVARFIELKLLEDLLSGSASQDLSSDRDLVRSVAQMASLPGETRLSQKSVDGDAMQPVLSPPVVQPIVPLRTHTLTLLGINNGTYQNLRKIEFKPGPKIKVSLSVPHSSKDGARVLGLAERNPASFLFRPAIAQVSWGRKDNGHVDVGLIQTHMADEGRVYTLTSVPSAVVRSAYVTGLLTPVQVANGHITGGEAATALSISAAGDTSKEAHAWLQAWARYCYLNIELPAASSRQVAWLTPVPIKLARYDQLLLVLAKQSEPVTVGALQAGMYEMFGHRMRDNNIWKEVRLRSILFRRLGDEDEESSLLELSEQGRQHATILQRVLAAEGQSPESA